jgi:predicted neutral ceramidase superfamily lipid hydrolase
MVLALVLVVLSRVLVALVLSKAQVARKMVRALALVVPKRVLAVQVLSKAQVAKKMVRALAERPARRMNTSLIKRRNSRSMIGEK